MREQSDLLDLDNEIENEEDSSLAAPKLLEGVVVTDTDWTVETVISQLHKGNIFLNPRFQRRDAWDDSRKSRFIESLFLGLPVPQLVLAEVPGVRGRYLVIDGKQRLLSLLKFAESGSDALRLKGLEVRGDLNGKSWSEIVSGSSTPGDLSAFENAPIRTTIVRGWSDERALYLIFHRLNSGSVPLSPQELRHVLHPGKFIDFAFDFSAASPVLISVLGRNGRPDFRMRDVEVMIRFFAFHYYIEEYAGDLKEFLDSTVKSLNKNWERDSASIASLAVDFVEAMETTIFIFGDDAFTKWSGKKFESRFNRAVFDVMTYFFADTQVRAAAAGDKRSQVRDAFIKLCSEDKAFVKSLEVTTKTRDATLGRLLAWGERLEDVLGRELQAMSRLRALK